MTPWYERLSVLDCFFLASEGVNSPMHVSAAGLFAAAPLSTADGGIDIERIRTYISTCLPSIPRYRQRLAYIPVENHPVWVDDDRFDLTYHVRQVGLPRPGSDAQLREMCAHLMERPLDRAKPLWEMWVIEGLAGGRFAILMRVHHCMVDGLGSLELLSALLRPTADTTFDLPTPWQPRPAPSNAQLLRDEVTRRTEMSIGLVRRLRQLRETREASDADWGRHLKAVWELVTAGVRRPVATPLNQPPGPHRRVHWATCDLAAFKEVKQQLGGTVNDVVLSVVGGAVRTFFERRGFATDRLDFRVAVPVNVRSEAERHQMGNHVSSWLLPLPIHERGPTRRFHAVRDISRHLKDTNQAVGAQILMETAKWTSTNVLTLGTLLSGRLQPFNLIVTNVPGPQFPLYFLGARMEAIYPQVPLFEQQSLGIALFSYDGKLFWGFNGDWDALPDLDEFVKDVESAFRELRRSAQRVRRRASSAALSRRPLLPARTGRMGIVATATPQVAGYS